MKDNKKVIYKIALLILVLCTCVPLFAGCIGPGIADRTYPLTSGFWLWRSSSESVGVSGYFVEVQDPDFPIPYVGDTVTGIAWNERYILVRQKAQQKTNYYIIDAYDLIQYGPYSRREFAAQKSALGIPNDLALEKPIDHSDYVNVSYAINNGYTLKEYFPYSDSVFVEYEAGSIPFVKTCVTKITWDERYILAERYDPLEEITQYCILDAREKKLYDNLTLTEFETQKEALGITEKLRPVSEPLSEEPDSTLPLICGYELYRKEGDDVCVRPAGDIRNTYSADIPGDSWLPEKVALYNEYVLAKLNNTDSGTQYLIIDTLSMKAKEYPDFLTFESVCGYYGIPKDIELPDVSNYLAEDEQKVSLVNGFTLYRTDDEVRLAFKNMKDVKYLSCHIVYCHPELHDPDETVSELAWDERYVLVKRLGFKRALPEEYKNAYKIPNEEDPHYYILDTVDHVLYGDYDLEAFNAKRQELGISDELKLESYLKYQVYSP